MSRRTPKFILAGLLLLSGAALANDQYQTGTGQYSPGEVTECQTSNGSVYSCALSDLAPYAVTVTKPGKQPSINDRAQVVTISPNSGAPGQYAAGAVAITGNASGTTSAVVGTLTAIPNKTTYICGFVVSSIGGTAATGPITIAGLIGSSMVYQLTSSATGVSITQTFTPCIPASATNTAITITTTANGTASAVNVGSWGFQL